jgi:hypothetical protein
LQRPGFVQKLTNYQTSLEKALGTVEDEGAALRVGRGPVDDCMVMKFEVGHGSPVERLLCYSREAL